MEVKTNSQEKGKRFNYWLCCTVAFALITGFLNWFHLLRVPELPDLEVLIMLIYGVIGSLVSIPIFKKRSGTIAVGLGIVLTIIAIIAFILFCFAKCWLDVTVFLISLTPMYAYYSRTYAEMEEPLSTSVVE
jgi:hypothetical protein